ncbi:MAG: ROK family protein [Acidimicrobiia bacterium]
MITTGTATFGVDLGGTNLRVGVVDADATVVGQRRMPTPATLDEIVAAIAGHVAELRHDRPDAVGLGVGAAGMVDRAGTIHYSPNVRAFTHAPVQERLLDVLAMPVAVDNDANVAALGELTHGAAHGYDDVLLVTLGTGVGGGVVVNGTVLRGAHGFGAEIGHFQVDPDGPLCACGERGHWEAVASGTALGALGRARAATGAAPGLLARADGDVDAIRGTTVGAAAQAGEADALAVLHEYAQQVGVGLVGLVNVLDPALVVVAGGLVDLGDVLLDPIRESFAGRIEGAKYRPDVPIVAAALGVDAGLVGAAVLARSAR